MTPTYWIHRRADGLFELRQWRYRESFVFWDDEHPSDVCAVAPTREQMKSMLHDPLKAEDKTDWGIHSDPRSDDFPLTERKHGPCWLHKELPIWIVEYHPFPKQYQPRHWQVYVGSDSLTDREPWCRDHAKLNHSQWGYQNPIDALHAASEYAALLGRKAK